MNKIHFSKIEISGFRGRYFELDMNPRGKHTVFVMDGNTGKTTTIELLRWCFKYEASAAPDRFDHMWNKPAHLLDDEKKGEQTCEIIIQFSALDDDDVEHFYKFTRTVTGEYVHEHPPVGDKISDIKDSLEIDYGIEVIQDDDVNRYLASNFRFNDCVEYFCFDGEKAREVMQVAADKSRINLLLEQVNRRVTHPRLEEYKDQLDHVKDRILSAANSRVTDRAIQLNTSKLRTAYRDKRNYLKQKGDLNLQLNSCELAISRLESEIQGIIEEITQAKAKNLIEYNKNEIERDGVKEKIISQRDDLYKNVTNWIYTDYLDEINQIKQKLKETGKLPEPYREDLINMCLENDRCLVCGRELDAVSRSHVSNLGQQVAPHNVHQFLDSDFSMMQSSYSPMDMYQEIIGLMREYEQYNIKLQSINLSEEDQQKIQERDSKMIQKNRLDERKDAINKEIAGLDEHIKAVNAEIIDLESKINTIQEYKIILDQVQKSMEIIDFSAEKIKEEAINIISQVMSEGIKSILGDRFSARFSSDEGLMLGENEFYGKEKGGYSGRLILSYCFAEAMTLVDPLIVDTPVGNIGTHREKLGEHLFANHEQVILLCLPTELANFAPIISDNPIPIENKEG